MAPQRIFIFLTLSKTDKIYRSSKISLGILFSKQLIKIFEFLRLIGYGIPVMIVVITLLTTYGHNGWVSQNAYSVQE